MKDENKKKDIQQNKKQNGADKLNNETNLPSVYSMMIEGVILSALYEFFFTQKEKTFLSDKNSILNAIYDEDVAEYIRKKISIKTDIDVKNIKHFEKIYKSVLLKNPDFIDNLLKGIKTENILKQIDNKKDKLSSLKEDKKQKDFFGTGIE